MPSGHDLNDDKEPLTRRERGFALYVRGRGAWNNGLTYHLVDVLPRELGLATSSEITCRARASGISSALVKGVRHPATMAMRLSALGARVESGIDNKFMLAARSGAS